MFFALSGDFYGNTEVVVDKIQVIPKDIQIVCPNNKGNKPWLNTHPTPIDQSRSIRSDNSHSLPRGSTLTGTPSGARYRKNN